VLSSSSCPVLLLAWCLVLAAVPPEKQLSLLGHWHSQVCAPLRGEHLHFVLGGAVPRAPCPCSLLPAHAARSPQPPPRSPHLPAPCSVLRSEQAASRFRQHNAAAASEAVLLLSAVWLLLFFLLFPGDAIAQINERRKRQAGLAGGSQVGLEAQISELSRARFCYMPLNPWSSTPSSLIHRPRPVKSQCSHCRSSCARHRHHSMGQCVQPCSDGMIG